MEKLKRITVITPMNEESSAGPELVAKFEVENEKPLEVEDVLKFFDLFEEPSLKNS